MGELLGFLAWLGVSLALASLGAWRKPARLPVKRSEPA